MQQHPCFLGTYNYNGHWPRWALCMPIYPLPSSLFFYVAGTQQETRYGHSQFDFYMSVQFFFSSYWKWSCLLAQRLAHGCNQGVLVFVNKILLECSHALWFTHCLCLPFFFSLWAELSSCIVATENKWSTEHKVFTVGLLTESLPTHITVFQMEFYSGKWNLSHKMSVSQRISVTCTSRVPW